MRSGMRLPVTSNASLLIAPVRELAGEWEDESMRLMGRDIEVTDIVTLELKQADMLRLVAAAERGSEHALGAAIVGASKERGLERESSTGCRGQRVCRIKSDTKRQERGGME